MQDGARVLGRLHEGQVHQLACVLESDGCLSSHALNQLLTKAVVAHTLIIRKGARFQALFGQTRIDIGVYKLMFRIKLLYCLWTSCSIAATNIDQIGCEMVHRSLAIRLTSMDIEISSEWGILHKTFCTWADVDIFF